MPDNPSRMLIGGALVEQHEGSRLPVWNPFNEEQIGEVPAGDAIDVRKAIDAAHGATPAWRATSWSRRADFVRQVAEILSENSAELAYLDAIDSGNPFSAMVGDVKVAVEHLNYFAGLAGELKGVAFEPSPDSFSYTVREPFGVVGRIVPFNHPLQFAAAKIAAPLVAGNTVVLKPSEHTSLSAMKMGELLQDVLPPGVLNIVTGTGLAAGRALVRDPRVRRISFTGSLSAGRDILTEAAFGIKSVTLELGGKNPMIVCPDVDVKAAAQGAIGSMNFRRSMGQSCGSTSRIFVHDDVYDSFLEQLVTNVSALQVGDPLDDATDMGPLAFKAHYERVLTLIGRGRDEGANVVYGGSRSDGFDRGYFVDPTIMACSVDNVLARDEIFGPVLSILGWNDEATLLRSINESEFGLTANVWTNNAAVAQRLAYAIDAGYVWINGSGQRPVGVPFGGYKHSGLGTETSIDELLSYSQTKSIISYAS